MYVGISTVNKEHEVLIKYYEKLCSIITDVNKIAPHCVTKKIISPHDHVELYGITDRSKQVMMLLYHITGPVEAGSPQVFYDLLDIMELYGLQATKQLAIEIKCSLNVESCCIRSCVSCIAFHSVINLKLNDSLGLVIVNLAT